jgi:hypothetical protein
MSDSADMTFSFNPEPQATAVSTRDCRPETAGACGFGLNKETAGACGFGLNKETAGACGFGLNKAADALSARKRSRLRLAVKR